MNKRIFLVFLFIMFGIVFQTSISFAQDSLKSKSSEEFIALKKGNFAIYLEFGSLLFKTASDNSNSELLLTGKYHLSDKTALRISGGTSIRSQFGNSKGYENGYSGNINSESDNFTFITSINIQYFLSMKSKVKPFISGGVYAKYSYDAYSKTGISWSKGETWGIGPFASFGAEMFVLDNISFIGEYVLIGTAGKSYSKYIDYSNYSESYNYRTEYRIDLFTVRAGLSIYF